MYLFVLRANVHERRVLSTDQFSYEPVIEDLRVFVYFRLANLLADGFLPRLGRCPSCRQFFLAKTQKKKIYCSQRCAQNLTAAERVEKSRERRKKWQGAREMLAQILNDMDAIAQKRRLQRPRSERQVLEESEKALEKGHTVFKAAFPREKGQSYEEGKTLLGSVEKRILKLRKRVKSC